MFSFSHLFVCFICLCPVCVSCFPSVCLSAYAWWWWFFSSCPSAWPWLWLWQWWWEGRSEQITATKESSCKINVGRKLEIIYHANTTYVDNMSKENKQPLHPLIMHSVFFLFHWHSMHCHSVSLLLLFVCCSLSVSLYRCEWARVPVHHSILSHSSKFVGCISSMHYWQTEGDSHSGREAFITCSYMRSLRAQSGSNVWYSFHSWSLSVLFYFHVPVLFVDVFRIYFWMVLHPLLLPLPPPLLSLLLPLAQLASAPPSAKLSINP